MAKEMIPETIILSLLRVLLLAFLSQRQNREHRTLPLNRKTLSCHSQDFGSFSLRYLFLSQKLKNSASFDFFLFLNLLSPSQRSFEFLSHKSLVLSNLFFNLILAVNSDIFKGHGKDSQATPSLSLSKISI